MRGEYKQPLNRLLSVQGTTSACAENTREAISRNVLSRNYLRVRGEYRKKTFGRQKHLGTTSACAENTATTRSRCMIWRNYLRVRGEYFSRVFACFCWKELPPRARRIHISDQHISCHRGTTSACAENTLNCVLCDMDGRNYLRVRGEYIRLSKHTRTVGELPPRARRIQAGKRRPGQTIGTTSACAENTFPRAGANY